MTRHRTLVGILVTAGWLAIMLIIFLNSEAQNRPLKLNEWGDFFAGFFAPVAFLWLVLGYLQQGQELQLSTKALELQAEELRNSVDQQRQLVEITREQVSSEMEALKEERRRRIDAAQPKFVIGGVGAGYSNSEVRYSASIENVGNTATEVGFSFEPPMKYCTITALPTFQRNNQRTFEFSYGTIRPVPGTKLMIGYLSAEGEPGTQTFELVAIPPESGSIYSMVEFRRSAALPLPQEGG